MTLNEKIAFGFIAYLVLTNWLAFRWGKSAGMVEGVKAGNKRFDEAIKGWRVTERMMKDVAGLLSALWQVSEKENPEIFTHHPFLVQRLNEVLADGAEGSSPN